MEQKTLDYKVRQGRKKGSARKLRRMGKIPSIIYGHREPLAIEIDAEEFNRKFKVVSESSIITLRSKDETYDVLVKDFQEDILRGKILHIDFYEIEKGKTLRTHVHVQLEGTAIGAKEGGILETLTHELEVECLPKDLPESIIVDISDLNLGHTIHVGDITAIEGVKFVTPKDQVVCTITRKKEEIEEEVVEGEEEVIEAESEEEAEGEEE